MVTFSHITTFMLVACSSSQAVSWPYMKVFVTSETYSGGELGGISGADAKCQRLANAAGLGVSYVAWLSDSKTSPAHRFYKASIPYVLADADKTVVADNWDDLIDGALNHPINVDENGNEIQMNLPGGAPVSAGDVFTGTKQDGTAITWGTCNDWTSSSHQTVISGRTDSDGSTTWTNVGSSCAYSLRLYCFEQYPVAPMRVFATASKYEADEFNGMAGADGICQYEANTNSLGGIYKSWLSGETGLEPYTRFYKSPVPYIQVNGDVIANNWDDLTDGTIDLPNGQFPRVWSGTDRNGHLISGRTCNNWGSTDAWGHVSRVDNGVYKTESTWCGQGREYGFWCFEQPSERRNVFVTSTTYKADEIGGLPGADVICNDHANAAGLNGFYKAWLSDSQASPSTRFYKSTEPYVQRDGSVIADDWDDLIDGALNHPINVDENGNEIQMNLPGGAPANAGDVFTGTKQDGTAITWGTCNDWTSSSQQTVISGRTDSDGATTWTNAGSSCSYSLRLYCFEQYPTSSSTIRNNWRSDDPSSVTPESQSEHDDRPGLGSWIAGGIAIGFFFVATVFVVLFLCYRNKWACLKRCCGQKANKNTEDDTVGVVAGTGEDSNVPTDIDESGQKEEEVMNFVEETRATETDEQYNNAVEEV